MNRKIILFASGNGSNAENICRFFEQKKTVEISGVYTHNSDAGVIQRLLSIGIIVEVFDKTSFINGELLRKIKLQNPNLIVLAGFIWKIGLDWIREFPKKIINIHPALLPKYGGKGMYGINVHKLIKEKKEKETGITIHYVNEHYDQGIIIFQKKINIEPNDTIELIAKKVHELEYVYFPDVINSILKE